MDGVEIEGLPERAFRDAVETMLRRGEGASALARVRTLLTPWCSPLGPLPALCLTMDERDVTVRGWNDAIARVAALERGGSSPITALGIDISSPSHRGERPDAAGRLDPHIEMNYYTDAAWPFSTSDRAGLLKGYRDDAAASAWTGNFEDIDEAISVEGLGELYGALWRLNDKSAPRRDEEQAAALAAMFVQILLHLAVRAGAPRDALPRPMAILVGSNEHYPYFDAPVFAAR